MRRRAWFALWLIALAPAPALTDDFVADDVVVSDPSSDLSPPEFDWRTKHMVWQTLANNLWVANVDAVTGAIVPTNGQGTRVDTGLSPGADIKNTPRYTWGSDQGAIVYNKTIDGIRTLAKAVEGPSNTWVTSLLENGGDRWKANGSPEETTDLARIVYNRAAPEGTVVSWRNLDDPASEQTANVIAQGGRFFGAEPSVIVENEDEFGVTQIYNIPFSTGTPEQVSFEESPNNVFNAFIWFAPEYQQYLIVAMVKFTTLAIYRQVDGAWTNIYQFAIPSGKPKLSSPEALVANGKSYIAVVTCDELGDVFPGQPVGPSEVWIAGIDRASPFFRRIDDPSYEAQRSEPEPFLLDNGPVVYYTELASPIRLLKRAATGLATDTGYDVAHYGGPWSTAFRDNKNCSCMPYPIADQYTSGYSVPMENSQFVHQTLGPEGHLYFGDVDTTAGGNTRHLVAIDATSGAEAYHIDEQTGLETFSATGALVDFNGYYYVPANDALSKYSSAGQRLWSVPTHGLSRSAQFTPDGNILFFTWDGWAYVVSPDGVLMLELNLTPGRTYPDNPTCLAPGRLRNDCSYVGPPAVNPSTKMVYVTNIRKRHSIVQAFQYQSNPTSLTDVWGTRITLTGAATNPVLSADYSRLYVQDGVGNLAAYDATTGDPIWSFPLGFRSDTPPIVNDNGYIMPGGSVAEDPAHNFIGLVQDLGTSATWVVHDSAYKPKSRGAAGAADRFVVAAREVASGKVKLLVVDPSGVVSASSWGAELAPNTLKSVLLRDDGSVFVQASETVSVKAFAPAP